MSDTLVWGAYGGNLEPLIELNDQDTWTGLEAASCCWCGRRSPITLRKAGAGRIAR
jgi:hypothetical protein